MSRKSPTVEMIRKVIVKLRKSKQPTHYFLEIKNEPLFEELLKLGKIRKSENGRHWEMVDEDSGSTGDK